MLLYKDGLTPTHPSGMHARTALLVSFLSLVLLTSHTAAQSPPEKEEKGEEPDLVTLGSSSRRFKTWSENHFLRLDIDALQTLELTRDLDYRSGPRSQQFDEAKLHAEVRRFLAMLTARDFEDFKEATGVIDFREPFLSKKGKSRMLFRLERNGIQVSESAPDSSLLEDYWITETQFGEPARYFTGICIDESFYRILSNTSSRGLDMSQILFYEDAKGIGSTTVWSIFEWPDGKPPNYGDSNNLTLFADVRLLLMTSEPDIAFPFGIRLVWNAATGAWYPLYYEQYNISGSVPNIVY